MAEEKKYKSKKKKELKNPGRVIPNNLEAEQAVLACAMIDPESIHTIVSKLSEKDFYSETHGIIYGCMMSLYLKNQPIDLVTVSDELERIGKLDYVGGMDYIALLTNAVPSAAYTETYINIVKKNAVLRQIINACSDITENAFERENGQYFHSTHWLHFPSALADLSDSGDG